MCGLSRYNVLGLGSSVSTERVSSFESRSSIDEKAQTQTPELFGVQGLESSNNRTEIQKQLAENWQTLKQQFEFIAGYAAKFPYRSKNQCARCQQSNQLSFTIFFASNSSTSLLSFIENPFLLNKTHFIGFLVFSAFAETFKRSSSFSPILFSLHLHSPM